MLDYVLLRDGLDSKGYDSATVPDMLSTDHWPVTARIRWASMACRPVRRSRPSTAWASADEWRAAAKEVVEADGHKKKDEKVDVWVRALTGAVSHITRVQVGQSPRDITVGAEATGVAWECGEVGM